ncbi:hypothetical protein OOT55_17075 [Marinimicrobium sp. C6131]|uniref:hypothetical protein n=1 Tax=Marinimicrobium sp. C6131 TaxID=3022676 RepID=UPI00223CDC2E|nr:hypothetical protein [Marinimicrobium sp. C6131]UZJ44350.1 hypothetical protein OOT55_17075 [Marinimicrobium sp. C6131]
MNTDYQLVATGTLTPLSRDVLDGASQSELSSSQSKRADWVKRIQSSMVEVAVTTAFPSYQSLGEGAWQHQVVERIYQAAIARTNSRLKHVAPRQYLHPDKSVRVCLVWDRLHDNEYGRPVYRQRWYISKRDVALLGYPGRLGEECFSDIVLATWHAGTDDAEAWRTHEVACAC